MILVFGDRESMCSPQDAISIWTGMPSCQPRETIVQVPTILDPSLVQVKPINLINNSKHWKESIVPGGSKICIFEKMFWNMPSGKPVPQLHPDKHTNDCSKGNKTTSFQQLNCKIIGNQYVLSMTLRKVRISSLDKQFQKP